MTIEVSTAIVISAISLIFTAYNVLRGNKRSDTKDAEARASERAEINIKLNHIASTTQEIKDQISSLVRDVQKHGDRLTKVEEGVKRNDDAMKRLHERIDNVEDRLNKEGNK